MEHLAPPPRTRLRRLVILLHTQERRRAGRQGRAQANRFDHSQRAAKNPGHCGTGTASAGTGGARHPQSGTGGAHAGRSAAFHLERAGARLAGRGWHGHRADRRSARQPRKERGGTEFPANIRAPAARTPECDCRTGHRQTAIAKRCTGECAAHDTVARFIRAARRWSLVELGKLFTIHLVRRSRTCATYRASNQGAKDGISYLSQ